MHRLGIGALLLCIVVISNKVYAGSLTPAASPAATGYTLEDIYNRITTGATASEGNHATSPSGSPAGTFRTVTEIYGALPIIDASKVLSGTSYLGTAGIFDTTNLSNSVIQQGVTWGESSGLAGTLTPDGGNASVAGLFLGQTAHLTDDWNLDTGTLTTACAIDTFDGIVNRIPNTFDGDGNGNNRWCITDAGTAEATDLLLNETAWVDGALVTGTLSSIGQQIITPTTTNQLISTGIHDGTGYCAGDVDLTANNIKQGTTIFGLAGDLTPNEGTASVASLFTGQTAHLTDDWTLDTGTLTTACAVDTFDGLDNLVPNTFDGDGNGTNRWCITDTGTAQATDLLLGQTAWVDGTLVTGTLGNVGQQILTPTTTNQIITSGIHNGTGYCAGDANLTAENIKEGTSLFGINGAFKPNIDSCGMSCTGSSGDICLCGNAGCTNISNGSGVGSFTDICTDSVSGQILSLEGKENGALQTSISLSLNCLLGGCDLLCSASVCYIE